MTVGETGDLLQELRSAAARIQTEGARIEKEFTQRRNSLIRESEDQLRRLESEQKSKREELSRAFDARAAHLEERFARRKLWITNAHATSRKAALDRIGEREGRRKFAVQKGILDAERNRDKRVQ